MLLSGIWMGVATECPLFASQFKGYFFIFGSKKISASQCSFDTKLAWESQQPNFRVWKFGKFNTLAWICTPRLLTFSWLVQSLQWIGNAKNFTYLVKLFHNNWSDWSFKFISQVPQCHQAHHVISMKENCFSIPIMKYISLNC